MTNADLPKRRKRDPEHTRVSILEAAKDILAQDGAEGLSISSVAKYANVDRGTVHRHFLCKEDLVRATLDWVGHQLLEAVYEGQPEDSPGDTPQQLTQAHLPDLINGMAEFNVRLAEYAIDNPEIGRIWLYDVLSRANPKDDVFYKRYVQGLLDLSNSALAESGMDIEVLAVIMLTSYFMWPVWVGAHAKGKKARKVMARRFAGEVLRLSMHGTMRADSHVILQAYLRRHLSLGD